MNYFRKRNGLRNIGKYFNATNIIARIADALVVTITHSIYECESLEELDKLENGTFRVQTKFILPCALSARVIPRTQRIIFRSYSACYFALEGGICHSPS